MRISGTGQFDVHKRLPDRRIIPLVGCHLSLPIYSVANGACCDGVFYVCGNRNDPLDPEPTIENLAPPTTMKNAIILPFKEFFQRSNVRATAKSPMRFVGYEIQNR